MSLIKAVLFDLDDTLWPIVPVIRRAEILLFDWLVANAPEVARRVSIDGMRARRQELMASDPVYQLDLRVLRRTVLMEAFAAAGADIAMVDQAMAVFSKARNEVTPFEDVLPTLKSLQDRVALGSVSNGVADLHEIGIAHFFQASVAAHTVGCAKPDAAIFLAACNALGIAPHETVYVGDDPLLDVEGAQKAGLQGLWINRRELIPARALPGHVQPDATFANLYELDQWLADRTVKL
ncbi:HAD family hydrolase [Herbaspirillum sp. HC18]|nr:HAD family hydrolase [Herbaspirillum sp. HC18]